MKTIKTLKILINLLYYILLVVALLATIYYTLLLTYPKILPYALQLPRLAFNFFDWKLIMAPVVTVLNSILFIYGIFLLKKTVPSFEKANFYSPIAIKNLKKAGKIFVFIGLSMMLMKMILLIIVQNTLYSVTENFNSWLNIFLSLLGTIDFYMICLIITGLFFMLFSDSFKLARELKAENDLTI